MRRLAAAGDGRVTVGQPTHALGSCDRRAGEDQGRSKATARRRP